MLLQAVIFILGLGILYVGADWLVRGASAIALQFGIRPMVVGLTIVALGTSMPELLLNLFAVVAEEDGLALGNIIGSNIANIALILGISSVLYPLAVEPAALRKEYPIMLGVSLLFWLLASDGTLGRGDGLILVSGLAAFMVYLVVDSRRYARSQKRAEEDASPAEGDDEFDGPLDVLSGLSLTPFGRTVYLVGGMTGLAIGAWLMVDSAVGIATALGIHTVVIGLTIVAIGTSLPELAASLLCVLRKEADMSVGNVLGSNMLNILFVVGIVSLIRPLEVEPVSIELHFPVMIGFTVLLFPFAWTQNTISRVEGGILLTGFVGYVVYLIYPYI